MSSGLWGVLPEVCYLRCWEFFSTLFARPGQGLGGDGDHWQGGIGVG